MAIAINVLTDLILSMTMFFVSLPTTNRGAEK